MGRFITVALVGAALLAVWSGGAWGQTDGKAPAPFRMPLKTFFYDAKLDTGQAGVPSSVTQVFADTAGTKHRVTWRPGFDVRVLAKRKRLGLPPLKARAWEVPGVDLSLEVDLDGKALTSYRFRIKRGDRFEVAVRDTAFVVRSIPGGDFRSPWVDVERPRLEFRANEEVMEVVFVAEVRVAGRPE